MKVMVTGGAGFIGSAVIRLMLGETDAAVVNVDKLTYAAVPGALAAVADHPRYCFEKADIADAEAMAQLFARHRPDAVMHLAAESHVDRSIDGPAPFIATNVVGTFTLLQAAQRYWQDGDAGRRARFRFHHVSTDEVYGSLGAEGRFDEDSPYRPNSPYAASKAAGDHLARAWFRTYGLPVVTSNCSNNYGPYQFPEKLIPLAILRALAGGPVPVYGSGANVRDWLYVEDHARALVTVCRDGRPGETYVIGGNAERTNIEVVQALCALLDEIEPASPHRPHARLIAHVPDRPGHDRRYAIDASKAARELGWRPRETFESGLRQTVRWYLDNRSWWQPLADRATVRRGLGTVGA